MSNIMKKSFTQKDDTLTKTECFGGRELVLIIEVIYEDDSFDHEFGTERCGHWEVSSALFDALELRNTKPKHITIEDISEDSREEVAEWIRECEENAESESFDRQVEENDAAYDHYVNSKIDEARDESEDKDIFDGKDE